MTTVAVTGSFDDMRSQHVRLLDEASKLGDVHVLLWSDAAAEAMEGKTPRFPLQERKYLVEAIRYVNRVTVVESPFAWGTLPLAGNLQPDAWVMAEVDDAPQKRAWAAGHGLDYRVMTAADLRGFPEVHQDALEAPSGRNKIIAQGVPRKRDVGQDAILSHMSRKVVVTGCYDWFHSGHVRFFEEVSMLGDLYVVVGHDENVRLLKGPGHPLFPQDERRYMVQAVRYVKEALVSSGTGWMDAEPEIDLIKPDIYAVNEDGDKPEKRAFCIEHGIQYVVLRRLPKEGLPARQSTDLRGF